MTIYTSSQASQAVAQFNLAVQEAEQAALIAEYQSVFDAIQAAADFGGTQVALRWTKLQYAQAHLLFTANGFTINYSVPNPLWPADGQSPTLYLTSPPGAEQGDYTDANDSIILYNLTINWRGDIPVTGPAITALSPTQFAATLGIPFSATFIPVGGTAPFMFSVVGNVPSGLTFNNLTSSYALTLTGTPTSLAVDYNAMTIMITDSANQTFAQVISWTVTERLVSVVNASADPNSNISYVNGVLTYTPYKLTAAAITPYTIGMS